MSKKELEMMKKLIKEKKDKKTVDTNVRATKKMGHDQKAFINKKTGGSLNK